jgi:SAM-dependent methyltransferase
VIDVGCGCGATTLAIAGRVGPRGRVLGVDVSAVMLARARERARSAGLANVEFADGDAQTHAFDAGAWDCVFSRFGVMFFADPARAFANLRRGLRRGGRASFACWRALPENQWVTVPFAALAKVVAPPPPPPPGAPGPVLVRRSRARARHPRRGGLCGDRARTHDGPLTLGSGLDDAVEFALSAGPASRLLEGASAADRARARAVVREALAPHARGGPIALTGAIWLVRAINPG